MEYVIILTNEKIINLNLFLMKRNIIYWSLIKCLKVTRSILILKLYNIIYKINIVILISITFKLITNQLKILEIFTIICINSFLFYKYIVKLSMTKEKCLMINIMAIC